MRGAVAAVMAAQKIAGGGGGGITLVQSKHMVTNPFGTTQTFTPDSTVTAGNDFIVGFFVVNAAAALATPPVTNTAVSLTQEGIYNTGTYTLYLYMLENAGSGVTSISWTLTGGNTAEAVGLELAGVSHSSPVDVTATGSVSFEVGPHDDVAVTTTLTDDMVVGVFRCDGRTLDTTAQAGTDYSALPAAAFGNSLLFVTWDLAVGTAGSKAPSLYWTVAGGGDGLTVAIKKA